MGPKLKKKASRSGHRQRFAPVPPDARHSAWRDVGGRRRRKKEKKEKRRAEKRIQKAAKKAKKEEKRERGTCCHGSRNIEGGFLFGSFWASPTKTDALGSFAH